MISHKIFMDWYNRVDVRFEIIKQLYNREFSLLVPKCLSDSDPSLSKMNTRMLKCHSLSHLDFIFYDLNVEKVEKFYQLYGTLAKYRSGIPDQTLDFKNRDNGEWKLKRHYDDMVGYDFLIDIDEDSHENINSALRTAKDIHNLMKSYGVMHEVRFSGMGFHILIPSECMPKRPFHFKDGSIYHLYKKISKAFNDRFSEMIDTSIYDSRRLCKLLYTLAIYDDAAYVCYPLDDTLIDGFDMEDFNIDNFNFPVRYKGRHLFGNQGAHELLKDMGVL